MNTNSKRIFLSPPDMGKYELDNIHDAFNSNWIAPLGPQVENFEKEMAEYVGIKGTVALSSGTAAIHLALKLLKIMQGDLVFCSTLTFAASANPIMYEGGVPVFIDSEPNSWNMSPVALRKAFEYAESIEKLPKAVIVVNLYGQSADFDKIKDICDSYNVPIIEDAAESLGATYNGLMSGTIGDYGIYSFNGNKIITTSGGGMLISNKVEHIEKARFLASQSRDPARHYQHSEIGYNYRMSNILAAIGRGQLREIENRISSRRSIFENYFNELSQINGIEFMSEMQYGRSNRWLTVMTINPQFTNISVNKLIDELEKHNIESRPVWKPMHLQPVFTQYKYFTHFDNQSCSDMLFNQGICLPSGSSLSRDEQQKVIRVIKKCFDY